MKRLTALVVILGLGILITQSLILPVTAFDDSSANNAVIEKTTINNNDTTESVSEAFDADSVAQLTFGGWTLGDDMQEIIKLPNVVLDDSLRKQLNTIFFNKPDSLDDISFQMLYTRKLSDANQDYIQIFGSTGRSIMLIGDDITDFEGLRFLCAPILLTYNNGLPEEATAATLFELARARAPLPAGGIGANTYATTGILVTQEDVQYQYVEQGITTYTYQPSIIPLMTDFDSRFDDTFPVTCISSCQVASMRTLDLSKISDFPIINNNLVDTINYNTATGSNVNPAGNTFAKYMYDEHPDPNLVFRDEPLTFTYDSATSITETTSSYFSYTERVGGFSAFTTLTNAKIIFTGRVEVQYLDTDGNLLAASELTEQPLQSSFIVPEAKTFAGYNLIKTPDAATVTVSAGTQVLSFIYEKPGTTPNEKTETITLPVTGENILPHLIIGTVIVASGILLLKKRK